MRSLRLTIVDMTDIPPDCLLAAQLMTLCGASGNNFPPLLVLELEQCERQKAAAPPPLYSHFYLSEHLCNIYPALPSHNL